MLIFYSEHKESNKVNKEIKDSRKNYEKNQPLISNQEPLRYGTVVKLVFIPT